MPIRPLKPQGTREALTIMPPVRSRNRPAKREQDNTTSPELPSAAQTGDETNYAVGYGKPPVANRFKPGQSGNPKGRPKAAKSLNTIVRDTLTEKVTVRTAKGERRISRIEATVLKTAELAMKGNPRTLAQLIKLYADAVPEAKSTADEQGPTEDLTATDLAMLEELLAMLTASQELSE